ncbi:MAG: DUF4412 domain-containing protein [Verrucomicrobiota bacterium]
MIQKVRMHAALVLALFSFSELPCCAVGPPIDLSNGYTAETTTTTQGMEVKSKIYFASNKMRTESNIMGQSIITIVRQDKKVIWNLMEQMKTYMEMPLTEMTSQPLAYQPASDAKWENLGEESIDNQAAVKWSVTFDVDGKKQLAYYWLRQEDDVLIRSEVQGVVTTWKNVKLGQPDAKLFELPTGYTKISVPGM